MKRTGILLLFLHSVICCYVVRQKPFILYEGDTLRVDYKCELENRRNKGSVKGEVFAFHDRMLQLKEHTSNELKSIPWDCTKFDYRGHEV